MTSTQQALMSPWTSTFMPPSPTVHPHHHRNAPDDRQVVRLGLFDARVFLGQQEDKAAVAEALFDRSDALVRPTRMGAIMKGKTTRSRSARTGSSAGISMVVCSDMRMIQLVVFTA